MANSRSLYQLEALPFSSREFHTKFTNLAGPLSLFDQEDNTDAGCENPEIARPLTPVEDAVKGPPSSFSTFAKLVHPRLCPREGISGLSIDDQQQLIGVLMVELNNIWQDVQRGPPDPFLTVQQNKELQRRLTIEIVVIAQGLFAKYLDKAQKLNQRGVFSATANLSRLKTQLALDANKSLNVLSLRRNLAADMKYPLETSAISSRFTLKKVIGAPQNLYRPLLVRQEEDKKARTHLTREEKDQLWVDSEIHDLQTRMPHMEPTPFMAAIPHGFTSTKAQVSDIIMQERIVQERSNTTRIPFLQKEKYASVPELFSREVVQEELDILDERREHAMKRRALSASQVEVTHTSHRMDEKRLTQNDGSAALVNEIIPEQLAKEDLTRLLTSRSLKPVGKLQGEDESDDLPPLLQSLAHYSTKKKNKDMRVHREEETSGNTKEQEDDDDATSTVSSVQSTEASSVAVNRRVLDDNITEFTGEEHPQPAIVSLRLPNKSVVRTSDVRVSNRINKASLTVTKHPTVYNDLSGEIDALTVKWLDKNLFIGEEIKEVYEEIIKTIGTDHLLFDKDDYVEKSAGAVNVSLSTASSTLDKPRSERIINKFLKRSAPPPWGKDTADNWRNSPKFGGLGREDILQAKLKKVEEDGHAHKSYNSWLAWWRSTITTDDFLKYLSTQENDYMSLMFHLYDSDHESDDEAYDSDFHPDTRQMALLRENERKLAELKTLKKHYQPGLWNVNSVLLGGLGNEPELNDDELLGDAESTHQTLNSVTPNKQPVARPVVPFPPSVGGWQPSNKSSETLSSEPVFTEVVKNRADSSDEVPRAAGIDAAPISSSTSEAIVSAQDRLERIWTHLCMPDAQRLDMAIKYSAEPHSNKLLESLTLWEVATEVILERESLMTKLEDFERSASDPNRFFTKGSTGSSSSRIRESKTRDWFGKRFSEIESNARKAVMNVHRQFGDTVTFQGRPYLEKMNMDRTEMFYWLQQERRHQVLEREFVKAKQVILKPPDLPPIEAHTML